MIPQTSSTPNSIDGLIDAVFACKAVSISPDKEITIKENIQEAKTLIEEFISRYNSGRAAV